MKTEQDQVLIDNARKAAESLKFALDEASEAGLILKCTANHTLSEFRGDDLVKQNNWIVRVFATRSVRY